MIATFCGWMLDGMDVMLYGFAMPALIDLWGLSKSEAGLLATVTLLVSAVGGWTAGIAADRLGRVRVLQATVLWFALFTCLSGFASNFHQLLVIRGLQGLGFGGEWAVGSVLIAEAIRPDLRGRAVGTVQSGWAIGWAMAAGFYGLSFTLLPPAIAWRALFFVGILPALLVVYIRRAVPEPAVYQDSRVHRRTLRGALEIFAPRLLPVTIPATLLAIGVQGGYYAITTWLPLFLKVNRGLSVLNTTAYLLVIIAGSFAGYQVGAHLADRAGRRRTLIFFSAGAVLSVALYTSLPLTNGIMLALGFPLGFFSAGSFSPIGAFFAELFPTELRASGQGFSFNFGRGIGAAFPALVGYLGAQIPLAQAILLFSVGAYALMAAATLALPETRGKVLEPVTSG